MSRVTVPLTPEALAAELTPMEADRQVADRARAERAERAAGELGRIDLVMRARLVVADVLVRSGGLAEAAPILHEVNAWAERDGDALVLARSHFLLSCLSTWLGDLTEARRHALLGVDHLPEDAPALVRGAHLVTLGVAVEKVSRADAARYYAEALDIAVAAGDLFLCLRVLNNMAFSAFTAGDAVEAATLVERMRSLAAGGGVTFGAADLDTIARVELMRGEYAAAERTLAPLLDPAAQARFRAVEVPEALLTVAELRLCQGRLDAAQEAVSRCAELAVECGLAELRARARREQARLHAAAGRYQEAYEEHCRFHAEDLALRSAEGEARARLAQLVFESREGRRDAARFRELALRDSLTGLYNRRFVDAQLPALIRRAAAEGRPLSAALVDVDFFKQVNDTFSHDVGDVVLQRIAALLVDTVPEVATVARLGGEEFLLVLPDTATSEALDCGEAVRQAVRTFGWRELTGALPVTVSVGVATTDDGRTTPSALLSRADRNLYAAKRTGRDRVMGDPA